MGFPSTPELQDRRRFVGYRLAQLPVCLCVRLMAWHQRWRQRYNQLLERNTLLITDNIEIRSVTEPIGLKNLVADFREERREVRNDIASLCVHDVRHER